MFAFSSRIFLTFAITLLSLASLQQLHAKNALQSRIDPLVQPYLDNETVMGLTIGVLHKGKAKVMGYGRVSEKNPKKPDGNTVYEIGSVSKVFTGLLLADAITQGHVQLDQPAGELLPAGVKMPQHENASITIKNLATHTSGLPRMPDHFAPADWNNPYADYSVEQLHAFLNRHQLARAPGEKSEYSNLGMGLLGHLLALQAEKPYEKLLLDRITKPLGMSSTSITLNKKQQSRLAPPHTADGKLSTNWDLPTLAGAGAIRSTARDMLLLAKALLSPPKNKLGKAIELAWQVHQKPLAQGEFAMGLAWHIAHDGSTRWHTGQTGGYHSMIYISREFDAAVVLLTNTATGEVDQLAEKIIQNLAGTTVEPRQFEKAINVAPEVTQRYVGKYQLTPELIFTVTTKGDQLFVQLTGQPALQVYARTETEWFPKVVKASVTFKVDAKGKCESLELFQNGVRSTAKRIDSDKPVKVTPKLMQRYVGKYQFTSKSIFTVTTKGKQLMIQLTGQEAMQVYPRTETEWFYKGVDMWITFQLDPKGNCESLELNRKGKQMFAAKRIRPGGVEPRNPEKPIKIAPEVMQRYVGKYQLTPQHIFTVTTKDNQLFVQLTGQSALPVYARTETEWFLKVVEATVTFNVDKNKKCKSLELFQNGIRQTAKRIK